MQNISARTQQREKTERISSKQLQQVFFLVLLATFGIAALYFALIRKLSTNTNEIFSVNTTAIDGADFNPFLPFCPNNQSYQFIEETYTSSGKKFPSVNHFELNIVRHAVCALTDPAVFNNLFFPHVMFRVSEVVCHLAVSKRTCQITFADKPSETLDNMRLTDPGIPTNDKMLLDLFNRYPEFVEVAEACKIADSNKRYQKYMKTLKLNQFIEVSPAVSKKPEPSKHSNKRPLR